MIRLSGGGWTTHLYAAVDPRGRPRKQIQVLNQFDSCCFNGDVYKTYAEPLKQLTSGINHGDWTVYNASAAAIAAVMKVPRSSTKSLSGNLA